MKEVDIYGNIVDGNSFTDFNELEELEKIFSGLNWEYKLIRNGRGGYYLFDLKYSPSKLVRTHIYLKRITFGGRASRPYEKRAQFSAALDREGFQNKNLELSLILGLYKRDKESEPIICAWDINDWGYNAGRAFNCFVSIEAIGMAVKNDFSQSRSSIGQIVYCFKPEEFEYYLENIKELTSDNENSHSQGHNKTDKNHYIPRYSELFQTIIDILKNNNGKLDVNKIEIEAAEIFNLSEAARSKIHNLEEGFRTELGYQLAWARTYLKLSGFIYSPKRAIWALTEKGWTEEYIDKDAIIKNATEKEIQKEIEKIDDVKSEEDIEIEDTDINSNEIKHPFDPSLVDIRTRTMTLDLVLKRLKNDAINLNTGFQRKANLWNESKQSRLIESVLVKFPLPAFYFDGSNDDNWLVVDGLQRLSSLDNYVNKQLFGLKGLEFLTQFEGFRFSELPGYLQRRIEEFEITAYVIAAGTPPELKYNVFKRINTGGLILTSQEIRNALNQGKPAIFVRSLAGLKAFKLATNYSISEDRMLDQEFVTRFLAFYIFDIDKEYTSDLDNFLNFTMSHIKTLSDDILEVIKRDFEKSMKAALLIFGADAFRKRYNKEDRRSPINKALFDSWSVILSKLANHELNILIENNETLQAKFMLLLNTDEEFNRAITSATGDKSRVKKRFSEVSKIVNSILKK